MRPPTAIEQHRTGPFVSPDRVTADCDWSRCALESGIILEPISNFQSTSRTPWGRFAKRDDKLQCRNSWLCYLGFDKWKIDVVWIFSVVFAVGDGLMRTLADSDRNTLPRGWVRQAVMGVLRWKELPGGRSDTLQKGATLQVNWWGFWRKTSRRAGETNTRHKKLHKNVVTGKNYENYTVCHIRFSLKKSQIFRNPLSVGCILFCIKNVITRKNYTVCQIRFSLKKVTDNL